MRNGASSVVSPLVRPSPSGREEQCLAAEEEGRKEGGEARPDEESRACEECLWEAGREGDSENRQLKCTASCRGLRGGEASVAANTSGPGTVGDSTTVDHDTYLVEEVRKTMPIKLISCQNGIQTCMLNDIS